MFRRIFLCVTVCAVLSCGAASTIAQVAVGPGFVDAPFVHVDWNHGRVHVVAPFVNVCVQAPPGCQAEPIPPPAQSNFRPSAAKQVVAAGYTPLQRNGALPTWSATRAESLNSPPRTSEKAIARDIARPSVEELPSPR
jgi:hypothetical protein